MKICRNKPIKITTNAMDYIQLNIASNERCCPHRR